MTIPSTSQPQAELFLQTQKGMHDVCRYLSRNDIAQISRVTKQFRQAVSEYRGSVLWEISQTASKQLTLAECEAMIEVALQIPLSPYSFRVITVRVTTEKKDPPLFEIGTDLPKIIHDWTNEKKAEKSPETFRLCWIIPRFASSVLRSLPAAA
jgi:hypothetical protein